LKVRSSVLDVDNPEVIKPDGTLTLRNFAELVTGAVLGMMKGMMTEKQARKFLPFIGTCAFVIFFSNVLGLIPGMLPPTDSLNTTVPCALAIFAATHIYGVKEHGLPYFKHFFGPMIGVKWIPLMALMLLIEVVSHLVRPVT
jgi:F-type H+-transporting ATPase subunit a